jgi:hypothetical protein
VALRPRLHEALRQRGKQVSAKTLIFDVTALWTVSESLVELRNELLGENETRRKQGVPTIDLPFGLDAWSVLPRRRPVAREICAKGNAGTGSRQLSAARLEGAPSDLILSVFEVRPQTPELVA